MAPTALVPGAEARFGTESGSSAAASKARSHSKARSPFQVAALHRAGGSYGVAVQRTGASYGASVGQGLPGVSGASCLSTSSTRL